MIDIIISDEYTKICENYYPMKNYFLMQDRFFPGPQAFCKKAVERVRSEKNILNSSVEWSVWSGWSGFLEKAICMYIIRSGSMS